MKANVRFVCRSYTGGYSGGDFDIVEGETVRSLIEKSLAFADTEVASNILDITLFMRNGKQAKLDDAIQDGDKLIVLQRIMGG